MAEENEAEELAKQNMLASNVGQKMDSHTKTRSSRSQLGLDSNNQNKEQEDRHEFQIFLLKYLSKKKPKLYTKVKAFIDGYDTYDANGRNKSATDSAKERLQELVGSKYWSKAQKKYCKRQRKEQRKEQRKKAIKQRLPLRLSGLAVTCENEAHRSAHPLSDVQKQEKPAPISPKPRAKTPPVSKTRTPPTAGGAVAQQSSPNKVGTTFSKHLESLKTLMKAHYPKGGYVLPSECTCSKTLQGWIKHVRHQYRSRAQGKKHWITDENIEQLEALGFLWENPSSLQKPLDKTPLATRSETQPEQVSSPEDGKFIERSESTEAPTARHKRVRSRNSDSSPKHAVSYPKTRSKTSSQSQPEQGSSPEDASKSNSISKSTEASMAKRKRGISRKSDSSSEQLTLNDLFGMEADQPKRKMRRLEKHIEISMNGFGSPTTERSKCKRGEPKRFDPSKPNQHVVTFKLKNGDSSREVASKLIFEPEAESPQVKISKNASESPSERSKCKRGEPKRFGLSKPNQQVEIFMENKGESSHQVASNLLSEPKAESPKGKRAISSEEGSELRGEKEDDTSKTLNNVSASSSTTVSHDHATEDMELVTPAFGSIDEEQRIDVDCSRRDASRSGSKQKEKSAGGEASLSNRRQANKDEVDITTTPLERQRTVSNAQEDDEDIKSASRIDRLSREDLLRMYLDQRDLVDFLRKERDHLKSENGKLKDKLQEVGQCNTTKQLSMRNTTKPRARAMCGSDWPEVDDDGGYFL